MRVLIGLVLVLLVSTSQAGLLHRRLRNVVQTPSEVRKDQIPVTIVQLEEVESLPLKSESKPEVAAPAVVLKALPEVVEKKEEIKLKATPEVVKNEQQAEEAVVTTEIKEEITQENKEFLKTSLKEEEKPVQAVAEETVVENKPQIVEENVHQVPKKLADTAEPVAPVVAEDAVAVVEKEVVAPEEDSVSGQRQATPATPPQQNIVQQIIQNTPIIGPFLTQLTGGGNPPAGVAADEGAGTPAPSVPIFQNPGAAISQAASQAQQAATQAVQNVFNSTSQAIQGIQQFASNIGNQVQNTISSTFGGQAPNADSTSPRPPGPIQSLINNIVGGNNQQAAAPAPAQQQQGPLQGILNIFQGNRPQGQAAVAPAETAASEAGEAPAKQGEIKPDVDDKVDITENEIKESGEAVDSFEETRPDDIVVHDEEVEVNA